jgi:riboflavin kinase/FMN adenylyltransferase
MARCLLTTPAERDALLLARGADAVIRQAQEPTIAAEINGPGRPAKAGSIRIEAVIHGGARVTSSRLRAALAAGDLALATALLGRSFSLEGPVVEGRRLGRELGAPTANIELAGRPLSLSGVFAAEVIGGMDAPRPAMAYIGTRPTVAAWSGATAPDARLLEVHVLDFDGDLYGRRLQVALLDRIRAEQRLASRAALERRIAENLARVRRFFAARRAP